MTTVILIIHIYNIYYDRWLGSNAKKRVADLVLVVEIILCLQEEPQIS